MNLILLSIFETATGKVELQSFLKREVCAGHIIDYAADNAPLKLMDESHVSLLGAIMECGSDNQTIEMSDEHGQVVTFDIQKKELLADKQFDANYKLNPNAISGDSHQKIVEQKIKTGIYECEMELESISFEAPRFNKNEHIHVKGYAAPGSKHFSDPSTQVRKIIDQAIK